ncbi:MAG: hypothetical protein AB1374_02070 [Bacillota bacterium]
MAENIKTKKITKVALPLVVALLVGAGGFFLGMWYQKSQAASLGRPAGQFGGMRGAGGTGGLARGAFDPEQGRPVAGEIIEKDEKSITIKLDDGSSKIVLLPDSTEFRKTTSGSQDDLKEGERVFVVGNENSDGSVTANMVQIGTFNRQD